MVYKVGITGGIGSGKTTVCKVFKLLGIPVFNADIESKRLVNTNQHIQNALKNLFGKGIYNPNNQINKKELADIIFNDELLLQQVNAIIHPEVADFFKQWVDQQTAPYVIHEAAILFESNFYKMMNTNILVSAPIEIRKERVRKRDGISEEEFYKRAENQWSDAQKRELTGMEIVNNNSKLVIPQIIEIDRKIKSGIA